MTERVLQFGTGAFLRAFIEPMLDALQMGVAIVQPTPGGLVPVLNAQKGRYTVVTRGLRNGQLVDERTTIGCVRRGIDPYTDFATFLEAAHNPYLRFLVSNTTEAGIEFRPEDRFDDAPPLSFPGKLTRFLHERWRHQGTGFILFPCELIENNGDALKRTVLQTAMNWNLPTEFTDWVERENTFTNTLVDRIVTGYPKDEPNPEDKLLDVTEPFLFWAIEAPPDTASEFPVHEIGFNVVWTGDLKPYRERKVHILNGAHTCMAAVGLRRGIATVGDFMADPELSAWIEAAIFEEIIPTLTSLPRPELEQFARDVLERFRNPYIRHQLSSIALHAETKFQVRVQPTIDRYTAAYGHPPQRLTEARAALGELSRSSPR